MLAKVDPARRSRRFKNDSSMALPPSAKGRSPSWPPCLATSPAACSRWLDRLIAGQVPAGDPARPDGGGRPAQGTGVSTKARPVRVIQSPKTTCWRRIGKSWRVVIATAGWRCSRPRQSSSAFAATRSRGSGGETIGGEVGPDLSGIGARQNRAYLLESIIDPDKQIAQGFESVVLATSDGQVHTGVLRGRRRPGSSARHRRGKTGHRAEEL